MKRMLFWGATGQAKILREAMRDSEWELVALFDQNAAVELPFSDIPLLYGRDGFEEWLANSASSETMGFLVAIGGSRGRDRIETQDYLESHGLKPLTCVHPTAFIADSVKIGVGSQVLANASVCVEAYVGRSCIINTGAIVDHECKLADGVHVGPGAHLAGCVDVAPYATIYTGAVVLPGTKIGESAIVGAGAVVTKDVMPHEVVAGNPARVLKKSDVI